MRFGKGVKSEKAQQALDQAGGLHDGEALLYLAKCNNLRPLVDALVVTNLRVLGLSSGRGFKYETPVSEIATTKYDPKMRTVDITTNDGRSVTFKAVSMEDMPLIERYVESARDGFPGVVLEEAAAPAALPDSDTRLLRSGGSRHERREAKRREKVVVQQQREEFAGLATRAIHGDPAALEELKASLDRAQSIYRPRHLEEKRLEIVEKAIQVAIQDDVVSSEEDARITEVMAAVGIDYHALEKRSRDVATDFAIARINSGRLPVLHDTKLITRPEEAVHAALDSSVMKEVTIREYKGGSSGISIPLGFGMRYSASDYRGRSVVVGTKMEVADKGMLYVTSQRCIFIGGKQTLEFRHDRCRRHVKTDPSAATEN